MTEEFREGDLVSFEGVVSRGVRPGVGDIVIVRGKTASAHLRASSLTLVSRPFPEPPWTGEEMAGARATRGYSAGALINFESENWLRALRTARDVLRGVAREGADWRPGSDAMVAWASDEDQGGVSS